MVAKAPFMLCVMNVATETRRGWKHKIFQVLMGCKPVCNCSRELNKADLNFFAWCTFLCVRLLDQSWNVKEIPDTFVGASFLVA